MKDMPYSLTWGMMLQVENLGHHQFFGDVAVLKSPIAQTTAVTANVTTTLLVISK